jgi:hypothetical protein
LEFRQAIAGNLSETAGVRYGLKNSSADGVRTEFAKFASHFGFEPWAGPFKDRESGDRKDEQQGGGQIVWVAG